MTKGPIDREAPVVIVDSSSIDIDGCNYMYIDDFDRYYFVDIKPIPGHQLEIRGDVDVLALPGIDSVSGLVIKSGTYADAYINDGDYAIESRDYTQIFTFSDMLNEDMTTYLVAMGGADAEEVSE